MKQSPHDTLSHYLDSNPLGWTTAALRPSPHVDDFLALLELWHHRQATLFWGYPLHLPWLLHLTWRYCGPFLLSLILLTQ